MALIGPGKMTGKQFEKAFQQLGMTQAGCGRFLGISERHMRRLVLGERKVDPGHGMLLLSMVHHGDNPVVPPWRGRRKPKPKPETLT
jgi:hypothetical protein